MKVWVFSLGLGLILFFVGCALPESFDGIRWDSNFTFPLMNNYYYVSDLEDGQNFSIDESDPLHPVMNFYYVSDIEKDYTIDEEMNINNKSSELIPIFTNTHVQGALSIDESHLGNDDDIDVLYGVIASTSNPLVFSFSDVPDHVQRINVDFLNVYTPDGLPLQIEITDFSQITSYDLANCRIGQENNTEVVDSLVFNISTVSSAGNGESAGLGRIYFDGHIYFSQLQGYLFNKTLAVNDVNVDIATNYPAGIDAAVTIPQASLTLNIKNELGFPVTLIGKLTAFNSHTHKERSIWVTRADDLTFAAAQDYSSYAQSSRSFSDSVSYLLNIAPDRMEFSQAKFVVGLNISHPVLGFCQAGDGAYGQLNGLIPFTFGLTGEPIMPDSITVINISSDNRKKIRENLNQSKLELSIFSSMPTGTSVKIYFSASADTSVIFSESNPSNLIFGPYAVDAALGVSEKLTELPIDLSSEQINWFDKPTVHMGLKFTPVPTSSPITLKPSDYLHVKGNILMNVRIEAEGDK